jgi:hypothetical protein
MTTTKRMQEPAGVKVRTQLRFDEISEPGCYLSNWSGHLIRVPEDAIVPGRSPVIEILGREPMIVTRLTDDPYITITKARLLAADLDLEVNF